jgi:hypothetical protein
MTESKKNGIVETEDSGGKKLTVVVKYPTPQQFKDAQLASITAFKEAVDAGAMTREGIDDYMKSTGMWTDEKQTEFDRLTKLIAEGESQLARGGKTKDGKKFTKTEARQLALDMKKWRMEQLLLLAKRRELDEYTVQGRAENTRFDYLVSECCYNEDKTRVFKDLQDYIDKSDEPYASAAASELSSMLYGIDKDFEKNKPENKFLVKFGFARDKDLRLINRDGHLVDSKGHLINEDGRLVDEGENLVNVFGGKVDKEGNPLEEFVPFDEEEIAPASA